MITIVIVPFAIAASPLIPHTSGARANEVESSKKKIKRFDLVGAFSMLVAIILLILGLALGCHVRLQDCQVFVPLRPRMGNLCLLLRLGSSIARWICAHSVNAMPGLSDPQNPLGQVFCQMAHFDRHVPRRSRLYPPHMLSHGPSEEWLKARRLSWVHCGL